MPAGTTEHDVARLNLAGGLSVGVADLIDLDDEFAGKAVDRLVQLISVEMGETKRAAQLAAQLGLV